MLKTAVRNTKKIVREKAKTLNVRTGRLYTKKETAQRMASFFTPCGKSAVRLLDPGAGTGILSAAALEVLCTFGIEEVFLLCYENAEEHLQTLESNLERMRKTCKKEHGIRLVYDIRRTDFLSTHDVSHEITLFDNNEEPFDYCIMHPPIGEVATTKEEMGIMESVCSTATDFSCLFLAVASMHMAEKGQLVAFLPTMYASGHYLNRIRRFVNDRAYLADVLLFSSPKGKDAKHMVLNYNFDKQNFTGHLQMSVTPDDGVTLQTLEEVSSLPYQDIVDEGSGEIRLFFSEEDLHLYDLFQHMPNTFASFGLRVRNGLTLNSRYPEALRDTHEVGAIPLLHPACLQDGLVKHPLPADKQYIIPSMPSLAQKNKNLLLIKRVPSRADNRPLVCGVYLASLYSRYAYISTNNKLLFVDYTSEKEMTSEFVHGLYALLCSDNYQQYCTNLTHSTQMHTADYASLPLPSEEDILSIGQKMHFTRQYTPKACTALVRSVLKPTAEKEPVSNEELPSTAQDAEDNQDSQSLLDCTISSENETEGTNISTANEVNDDILTSEAETAPALLETESTEDALLNTELRLSEVATAILEELDVSDEKDAWDTLNTSEALNTLEEDYTLTETGLYMECVTGKQDFSHETPSDVVKSDAQENDTDYASEKESEELHFF